MRRLERIAGTVVLATVIIAWIVGAQRTHLDLEPFLREALPGASSFEEVGVEFYAGRRSGDSSSPIVGYVAVGRASGYGGPMLVAVGINTAGSVRGLSIIDHKETTPFFDKVKARNYPEALVGKNYDESFSLNDDVDAVSGATASLGALLASVRRAVRRIAADALKLPVQPERTAPFQFGFPEALLILLFVSGFLTCTGSLKGRPGMRKYVRWGTRITGLIFLGFIFAVPLSIVHINSLLAGYWPNCRSHAYWYLLMAGALLPLVFANRDVYCQAVCPFGATQDVLKVIGGRRRALPAKYHAGLRWLQRALAWTLIVLALLCRDPGRFNYEVFGSFFRLTGTTVQLSLLALVLTVSLFLVRPWCSYLCPLRAVSDYVRMLRRWVKDSVFSNTRSEATE
jgi:NosR/NirI family transcriptional regulator, nitrous oxide reductase regulator